MSFKIGQQSCWKEELHEIYHEEFGKEVECAGDSITSAIKHLFCSLAYHDQDRFYEASKLVKQAIARLDDWERSNKEMKNIYLKSLDEQDMQRRRHELVDQLTKMGVDVVLVKRT